jgi:hypothetical protein
MLKNCTLHGAQQLLQETWQYFANGGVLFASRSRAKII